MNKKKILKILKRIIQLLMIIQIFIGIVFIIKNINYMPNYGDTKEFLELAETMKLDSARPFVYPLMLRYTKYISNFFNVNITYIAYSIQGIINCFACFILVKTLKDIFNLKINKFETLLYTLFIFSIPFNMHFNMSIKCDSIATSFTILFICYLIMYLRKEKYRYAIYATITMFITNNIRSERLYFLSFVLIATIIFEIIYEFVNRKQTKFNKFKIIILFGILIIGIVSTKIAGSIFQDSELSDRNPSVMKFAYERIVGNTLPEIYEYLPEDIKEDISYDEAVESTLDRNWYINPYQKLYSKDGNTERIKTIMKIAIRRNFPDIIYNVLSDFSKNVFSPYYFLLDNNDWSYTYTLTRMEGEHYLFTDAYTLYFAIMFAIINIYIILLAICNSINIKIRKEMLVIVFYTIVSSGFFALLTSQNFHIRYAMPIYVIEIAIIVILLNIKEEKANE